jgi:hypothetical protein
MLKRHFRGFSERSGVRLKADQREWFYYIDHKGFLFLEETEPKNYTSCLKDDNFLNFFFKNLRPNQTDKLNDYPYLSPCWGEQNYVKCHSNPVVFREMDGEDQLVYGGDLKVKFDPSQLS